MDRLIEEMTVDNRVIKVIHDSVPIDQIELDRDNPRIKYRVSLVATNGKRPTEKQLEQVILSFPEVKDLLTDIKHSGGLHERVILRENGGGKYKAVEGNCRTTCIRELRSKDPKDDRWKSVPARILPQDADARVIARLLTSYHVAGKIQWKPHEKAGQCYYMSHDLQMKQEDIAIAMHASKGTVNRYLTAYSFFVNTFLTVDGGAYGKEARPKVSGPILRSSSRRRNYETNWQTAQSSARIFVAGWVRDGCRRERTFAFCR